MANMTNKEREELIQEITKIFDKKSEELVEEFSAHLDKHMDEIEDMLEEGFEVMYEHIKVLNRVKKLEKKISDLETTGKGKRFIV